MYEKKKIFTKDIEKQVEKVVLVGFKRKIRKIEK